MARYVTKHWEAGYEGVTRAERKGGPYRVYEPDALCGRTFMLDGSTAANISDAERALASVAGDTAIAKPSRPVPFRQDGR